MQFCNVVRQCRTSSAMKLFICIIILEFWGMIFQQCCSYWPSNDVLRCYNLQWYNLQYYNLQCYNLQCYNLQCSSEEEKHSYMRFCSKSNFVSNFDIITRSAVIVIRVSKHSLGNYKYHLLRHQCPVLYSWWHNLRSQERSGVATILYHLIDHYRSLISCTIEDIDSILLIKLHTHKIIYYFMCVSFHSNA